MKSDLPSDLTHVCALTVNDRLVVPALAEHFAGLDDMPPVFATAFMVGFAEWTCVEALRPYLDPGEASVGVRMEISHLAATPIGFKVTAEVRLIERTGRKLRFAVTCRDDLDVIGEGVHDRAIIDQVAFRERTAVKAAKVLEEKSGG